MITAIPLPPLPHGICHISNLTPPITLSFPYLGTLPLGTLPENVETLRLPSFNADNPTSLAELVSGLAQDQAPSGTPSQLTPSSYSPTARLPKKLVTRIQALDFIEMNEMLQESWIPEAQDASLVLRRPSRRAPITDILAWTECFALMAAVLAEKFPDKAPQLFAYLRRIVHAARNFQGSAWVAYDRLYRRQALARHSLDWAQEDSALYNEAFVGHARAITRCRHCLSEFHTSESCPEFQQQWGPWPPEFAMSMVPPRFYPPGPHQEACRKFNENRCFLRRCRYLHVCSICSQPHPASFCAESPTRMRLPHQTRDRSPRQQRQEHRMLVAGKRP